MWQCVLRKPAHHRYILGTHEDIKPIILSKKAQWGQASFDEFFRCAQALGDSHRALLRKRNRKCQAMFVWPSDAHAHPAEGGETAYSHSRSGEPRQGTVAGDQVFTVGQAADYCGSPEEHSVDTRYDQVFPPGCHEAHMVGRDANQVRFRGPQRQRDAGRPSAVGVQMDSATKAARPGWVNNAPTNVDACYAYFGVESRRPDFPHKDGPPQDPNFAILRIEDSKFLQPRQQQEMCRVGAAPKEAALDEDDNLMMIRGRSRSVPEDNASNRRTSPTGDPPATKSRLGGRQGWAGCNRRIGV